MNIEELTKRVNKSAKNRTFLEEKELLCEAKILNKDGSYCADYFSEETIKTDENMYDEQLTDVMMEDKF